MAAWGQGGHAGHLMPACLMCMLYRTVKVWRAGGFKQLKHKGAGLVIAVSPALRLRRTVETQQLASVSSVRAEKGSQ